LLNICIDESTNFAPFPKNATFLPFLKIGTPPAIASAFAGHPVKPNSKGKYDAKFCQFSQPDGRIRFGAGTVSRADRWHRLNAKWCPCCGRFLCRNTGMNALDSQNGNAPSGSFRLNKARGKFMGVSAGISDYFGIDVTLVRIAWVVGTLLGVGSLLLVYLAIGLIAD
jgi:phage shock protein C